MNILRVFAAASWLVKTLPEPVGRAIFRAVGTVTGASNMRGAVQLRANLERIVPAAGSWRARRRSAKAMRSYMDYYYEMFRLSSLTPDQIDARVSCENVEAFREHLAAGRSASAALLHTGNWDLAGAWATKHLAPVHSIAEKLNPPELADQFLDFRRSIGLTIYQTGGGAIASLERSMREESVIVTLLCDRDLSASGVQVNLTGKPVRVAVGSALLAQRTGEPMWPITIVTDDFGHDAERVRRSGSRYGIKIIFGEPISAGVGPEASAEEREADILRMNQEWLDQVGPLLARHVTDWHMLQKVFVEDLDPERLARAKETT
ncbi:phosphatidylinositol mannoside acyltransferase [Trueperella bernardiae]|uniref:phosphatidylinositol mannoside acyltransferase n=1 Tax=Trueperella bernardiae TaxID=59561 RepID=UPI00255315AF|nr:phosphatidylinositol mannoside acyltransferase [Trueperella bernardiae]WIM08715.1 phosphatidylinositol mannoside acyltransferase [Trueperella bernardiae]